MPIPAQALLIDREREAMTLRGLRASRPIGLKARVAAIRAYQRGGGPSEVAAAVRAVMLTAAGGVADGMIAAHLQGLLRSKITAAKATRPLTLANPYRAAMALLERRLDLTPAAFSALAAEYGVEALSVASDLSAHAEGKAASAIATAIGQGLPTREGVASLRRAFDAAGITPGQPHALETMYRTQVQMGYSAGRWQANDDPAIQEILWGYRYVTMGDDRVRPNHAALDNYTARKGDPAWTRIWPPCGYNCHCTVIEVFNGDAEAVPTRGGFAPVDIGGVLVTPAPDLGWDFNAGLVFAKVNAAA